MNKVKDFIVEEVAAKRLTKDRATELLLEILRPQRESDPPAARRGDIAIVSMACRLPQANTPEEFWRHLAEGADLVRSFPESRRRDVLDCSAAARSRLEAMSLFEGAFLDKIDEFDAEEFGIAPAEARLMDPAQRLFLEVAAEALETAGLRRADLDQTRLGVYLGHTSTEYGSLLDSDEPSAVPGNTPAITASRLAYVLNLRGPTMLVDTTCSSSAVSVHLACEAIRNRDCDSALVGGVHLVLYAACKGAAGATMGILSPSRRAKPFDAAADGTGIGEGVIAMVLKPLADAERDGDVIHAVIKGSAINSDGRSNGLTAPNARAQTAVILDAWRRAGINPSDITLVEAHGTGTKLGDPIELEGLRNAFAAHTNAKGFCALGATKANVGHLDTAAGLVGLLKTVLCLRHRQLPPLAHFHAPNPLLEIESSPFVVPQKLVDWKPADGHYLAGVSSFGLSGTNCHIVVAGYQRPARTPNVAAPNVASEPRLVLFSGRSWDHLREILRRMRRYLETCDFDLGDLAYTLAARRDVHTHRLAIICSDRRELLFTMRSLEACEREEDARDLPARFGAFYGSGPRRASAGETLPTALKAQAECFIEGAILPYGASLRTAGRCLMDLPASLHRSRRAWPNPDPRPSTALVARQEPAPPVLQTISDVFAAGEDLVAGLDFSAGPDYDRDMRQFCGALTLRFFRSQGVFKAADESHDMDALFASLGFLPRYRKFFNFMLRTLAEGEFMRKEGGRVQSLTHGEVDVEDLLARFTVKYPAHADCFRFPYYVAGFFPEVLTGRMSPLSVMYPGGNLQFQSRFSQVGDAIGNIYGKLSIEAIARHVQASRKRPLRILEVGAGMGVLTNIILPKIADVEGIEYCFTDIGAAFVQNARKTFAVYPSMKYAVYDISKSPVEQGLEAGSFDIALAFNVVHTCKSVVEVLGHMRDALTPDGALFMCESAKNEAWATLAWGILEGWWNFEDFDLRPEEPMLPLDTWERAVRLARFDEVYTFPTAPDRRQLTEKALIVAKRGRSEVTATRRPAANTVMLAAASPTIEPKPVPTPGAVVAPADVKGALRAIWLEVLGHDEIGLDDDFYERGGDSLLAVKLLELVRTRLGVPLEISDIFAYNSIRKQAEYLEARLRVPATPTPTPTPDPRVSAEPAVDPLRNLLDQVEDGDLSVQEAAGHIEEGG